MISDFTIVKITSDLMSGIDESSRIVMVESRIFGFLFFRFDADPSTTGSSSTAHPYKTTASSEHAERAGKSVSEFAI